jgi:hypothetical protein
MARKKPRNRKPNNPPVFSTAPSRCFIVVPSSQIAAANTFGSGTLSNGGDMFVADWTDSTLAEVGIAVILLNATDKTALDTFVTANPGITVETYDEDTDGAYMYDRATELGFANAPTFDGAPEDSGEGTGDDGEAGAGGGGEGGGP